MKLLFLSTGAFGCSGGIAEFERSFLSALCSLEEVEEVLALPRNQSDPLGTLPEKLDYRTTLAGSKLRYLRACTGLLFRPGTISLVICGHINLLPFAYLASGLGQVPIALITHGIEVWQPKGKFTTSLLSRVQSLISVSEYSLNRMREWAPTALTAKSSFILPNGVDTKRFTPGTKRDDLIERHGLAGRKVLLTVARLAPEERYKGIDEVLEALPSLIEKIPNLSYLIVGKGEDRARLETKVVSLALVEHVIFAGYVPESEKADYYRLADVFVMPSSGEGFGIVFLEAMACGIPVIAGNDDGAQEALRGGSLGALVDPGNTRELTSAIEQALAKDERVVPNGLDYFSAERFEERVHSILRNIL